MPVLDVTSVGHECNDYAVLAGKGTTIHYYLCSVFHADIIFLWSGSMVLTVQGTEGANLGVGWSKFKWLGVNKSIVSSDGPVQISTTGIIMYIFYNQKSSKSLV